MRSELEPLPPRLLRLPIDKRGYPVPWFVAWKDGEPEFRAMDGTKFVRAIRERLCWCCGRQLGLWKVFVAGPMCGINRTSSEPPSHLECAQWSARNCPFLTQRQYKRREDELLNRQVLKASSAGFALDRQPGVAMLWVTRSYTVFDDGQGKPLIRMGDPERVEWYSHGRAATRAEVEESVRTGLPFLEEMAAKQTGASAYLAEQKSDFERLYPEA